MILYDKARLTDYLTNDVVLQWLLSAEKEGDTCFRTQQWLKEIAPKRMIFKDMYGDLLNNDGISILDVGGGFTSLTRNFLRSKEYTLLDFMAHGEHEALKKIQSEHDKEFWICKDWYEWECKDRKYDIIVANDIFPDVAQRMELFLDKFLPICKEIRILLTYYNTPKFYLTKRVDDTELLTFLSWDGEVTAIKLKKYMDRIEVNYEMLYKALTSDVESVYRNGRQVALIKIRGDL